MIYSYGISTYVWPCMLPYLQLAQGSGSSDVLSCDQTEKINPDIRNNKDFKQMQACYTTLIWRPLKGYVANNADPDQMQKNAASNMDLHCLHQIQEFL